MLSNTSETQANVSCIMTYCQVLLQLLVDLWTDGSGSSLTLLRSHPDGYDVVCVDLFKGNAQLLCDLCLQRLLEADAWILEKMGTKFARSSSTGSNQTDPFQTSFCTSSHNVSTLL